MAVKALGSSQSTGLGPIAVEDGGTSDFGGGGAKVNIPAEETVLNSGTTAPVPAFARKGTTVDGATFVDVGVFTPAANSGEDWNVTVMGLDVTGAPPITGDYYRADIPFTVTRIGAAAPVIDPGPVAAPINVHSRGAGSTYTSQVVVVGNDIHVQVRGNAATTVHWTCIGQVQSLT